MSTDPAPHPSTDPGTEADLADVAEQDQDVQPEVLDPESPVAPAVPSPDAVSEADAADSLVEVDLSDDER